ncbi:MAG: hypothetical protein KDD66_13035, partial [Bdellovibrionales bacterium]|nr:hypothetical protein [Bdellovibrionales bacterium]
GNVVWGPTKIEPPLRSGTWSTDPHFITVGNRSWAAVFTEAESGEHVVSWSASNSRGSVNLPPDVLPLSFDSDLEHDLIAVSIEPGQGAVEEAYASVVFVVTSEKSIAARYHLRSASTAIQFLANGRLAVTDSLPDQVRTTVLNTDSIKQ